MPAGEVEPLMTLLRRYATEAAREEARMFCDELVEMGNVVATIPVGGAASAAIRRMRARWRCADGLEHAPANSWLSARHRRERRREDRLQIVRPVAVLVHEELVGHVAQLLGEPVPRLRRCRRAYSCA